MSVGPRFGAGFSSAKPVYHDGVEGRLSLSPEPSSIGVVARSPDAADAGTRASCRWSSCPEPHGGAQRRGSLFASQLGRGSHRSRDWKSGSGRALRARAGRRRGQRGRPVLQEPPLGAADGERRDRPRVLGFLLEVREASHDPQRSSSLPHAWRMALLGSRSSSSPWAMMARSKSQESSRSRAERALFLSCVNNRSSGAGRGRPHIPKRRIQARRIAFVPGVSSGRRSERDAERATLVGIELMDVAGHPIRHPPLGEDDRVEKRTIDGDTRGVHLLGHPRRAHDGDRTEGFGVEQRPAACSQQVV